MIDNTETCSCIKGYVLNADDGQTCDEINECDLGTDACDQVCTNTVGSYNCSCNDGFTLDEDGFACVGMLVSSWHMCLTDG